MWIANLESHVQVTTDVVRPSYSRAILLQPCLVVSVACLVVAIAVRKSCQRRPIEEYEMNHA